MNTTTELQNLPVFPVQVEGRNYHRGGAYTTFRKVHFADDVNDGRTLCGLDLTYVTEAGKVRLSVPKAYSNSDVCGDCRTRGLNLYTGPKWGLEWSD